VPGRARQLATLRDRVIRDFEQHPGGDAPVLAERGTPWFEHGVTPMLGAWLQDRSVSAIADVVNGGGAVPELPVGAVVEVETSIDGARDVALSPGPLPPAVSEFLTGVERAEALAYAAIRARDRNGMRVALEALPIEMPAGRMNDLIRDVCDGYRGTDQ
jgi:alpha-galactosidase/6-phospho-beta-glucosidase family protein